MGNFDFTQFISLNSKLPYEDIRNIIKNIFSELKFSIVEFEEIELVKKDYFDNYWLKYTFELVKDDFLGDFMNWKEINKVPREISDFEKAIEKLLQLEIDKIQISICSFAERGLTTNEEVSVKKDKLVKELFKMSPYSSVCPNNMIINI